MARIDSKKRGIMTNPPANIRSITDTASGLAEVAVSTGVVVVNCNKCILICKYPDF
jgi:hypothetical protein